jgi:Domain of unknown function (DUF4434)
MLLPMSDSMSITRIDDFKVVGGQPENPDGDVRFQAWEQRTQAVLDGSDDVVPRGRLSGSFIYAHPPDYRGRPAVHFGVEEWRTVFREFRELGLEYAIWQASAWSELRECYYPSAVLSDFKQWNVIEPMLQAAHDENLAVYLGSLGVLSGELSLGVSNADVNQAMRVAEQELACSRELFSLYSGGFQGYYLSSETYYAPKRNPLAYKHYGMFFERVTGEIKSMDPDMKILASPAAFCPVEGEGEAVGRLMECFGRASVDIFAPMDCTGQMRNLDVLERDLGVWGVVAEETGAEFWVNCESFTVRTYTGEVMSIEAADPMRFLYQMALAERLGAQKLLTWEAMHFMDPNGDEKARALRSAVLAHHSTICT